VVKPEPPLTVPSHAVPQSFVPPPPEALDGAAVTVIVPEQLAV